MTTRAMRWGGAAGIIFVALILVTVFAPGSMPKPDDSIVKIQNFYTDHHGSLLLANFLGLVAVPFVLWFGVMLREALRGDRLTNAFGTTLLVGLVVTVPMAILGGVLQVAPAYLRGAAVHIDGNTLRLVFDAQGLTFAATSAGLVTFALASAAAIRRSRGLPVYTMWLALLAVAGNILAMISALSASVGSLGFAGVGTFSLFVLVTGITMAAGKASAVAATE